MTARLQTSDPCTVVIFGASGDLTRRLLLPSLGNLSEEGLLLERGESDSSLATIGTVDYRHAFNESTTLLDKFTVEHTSEDTFVQNEITLQVKMLERVALAVGYAVRYHSDPPPGFGNTDTLTTMNVVYEVK